MTEVQSINFNVDSFTAEHNETPIPFYLPNNNIIKDVISSVKAVSSDEQSIGTITPWRPMFANRNRKSLRNRSLVQQLIDSSKVIEDLNGLKYDTMYVKFPEWFSQAPQLNKIITMFAVHVYDLTSYSQPMPLTVTVHSDMVQRDATADYFVCVSDLVNPKPCKVMKSEYLFQYWFRKINGDLVDLDPSKTRVILEFVLNY